MAEKQKRFADEYLIDLNGTRAYKAAYPNVKKDEVAAVNASKLLRNAKVQKYIKERLAQKDKELVADQDEVLRYLTRGMRGELTEEVVVTTTTGEVKKVNKGISIKDSNKCAELLGKRHGAFIDKITNKEQEYKIAKIKAETAKIEAENKERILEIEETNNTFIDALKGCTIDWNDEA